MLKEDWTEIIGGNKKWFRLGLSELWEYRELVLIFVRRDFIAVYKQTILGPLWHLVQPVLTTLIFTIVFGKVSGLSTNGSPGFIFYLCGIIIWSYFSKSLIGTSNTFVQNASIFGKVYFPRLAVPFSIIISSFLSFLIQFILFSCIFLYYYFNGDVNPNFYIFFTPFLILILAILSLGIGMIFSSLTTKYRDLSFLLTFGIQLLMFVSPVIYPISIMDGWAKILIRLNPITSLIEGFRYAFLGTGEFDILLIIYSASVAITLFISGVVFFHRMERSFIDTV